MCMLSLNLEIFRWDSGLQYLQGSIIFHHVLAKSEFKWELDFSN